MSDGNMVKESNTNVLKASEPKFRKWSELSIEQQLDPDYRLKQLAKLNEDNLPITCSKCHHCRR